jgi:hypothetical protein
MVKRARQAVGILLAATGAVMAFPSSGSAAACNDDMVTEAGTCATPVPGRPLTDDQKNTLVQKNARRQVVEAALASSMGNKTNGGVSPAMIPPDGGTSSTVANYRISSFANMTFFKEGQGNGKKSYTCGPSASRNVIYGMTGVDYGESQFATWEGTTTDGTSRANIASALNNHFSSVWATTRPADRASYLTYVISDTKYGSQGVIANVDTEFYSFFNGHALNHFDFVYGFDNTASTKYLYVGEEWDPIFIYGSSSYGNPYGKHKEKLINSYNAVNNTSYHGIVW